MTDFTSNYLDLLIYQYRDKPNASAEIQAIINPFSDIYDLLFSFEKEFDLDTARGKQLDILGKIIGQARRIEQAIPKNFFGFYNKNTNARSFGYPFFKKGDDVYASLDLTDSEYRIFLKMKVAYNNMYNNINLINEMVFNALDGYGYVKDNYDMTFTFYLHESLDVEFYKLLVLLDKLPRPAGIRYNSYIIIYDDLNNETTYSL